MPGCSIGVWDDEYDMGPLKYISRTLLFQRNWLYAQKIILSDLATSSNLVEDSLIDNTRVRAKSQNVLDLWPPKSQLLPMTLHFAKLWTKLYPSMRHGVTKRKRQPAQKIIKHKVPAQRKVLSFYLVLLIDQLLLETTFLEDPIASAFNKHVKLV